MGGKNRMGRLVRRRGGKELRVRREKGIERKRSYRAESEKGERD